MKKIVFLSLLILAACSYEPEVKPSPPYGANGILCGAYNYTNWIFRTPPTGWSGNMWSGNSTKTFSSYFKPSSAGSTFLWVNSFSAIIRIRNLGRVKFRATYGDWWQDVSVGGYVDFYYTWDSSVLGNIGCSAQVPDTTMPITITFQRLGCGSTSGEPNNGYYYMGPHLQVISATNGNNFNGIQAFAGEASAICP